MRLFFSVVSILSLCLSMNSANGFCTLLMLSSCWHCYWLWLWLFLYHNNIAVFDFNWNAGPKKSLVHNSRMSNKCDCDAHLLCVCWSTDCRLSVNRCQITVCVREWFEQILLFFLLLFISLVVIFLCMFFYFWLNCIRCIYVFFYTVESSHFKHTETVKNNNSNKRKNNKTDFMKKSNELWTNRNAVHFNCFEIELYLNVISERVYAAHGI